jgi:hypothetical protein
MKASDVRIDNADEVSQLLDDRGIKPEDVREAIAAGETTGTKLYCADDDNRFLVRAVLGKFNIYVQYSPGQDGFTVHTAYSHRIMLALHDEGSHGGRGPATIWNCFRCRVVVEEVDDIALHYNEIELPNTSGYRCPACGLQLLPETFVMAELFRAEMMLEAK